MNKAGVIKQELKQLRSAIVLLVLGLFLLGCVSQQNGNQDNAVENTKNTIQPTKSFNCDLNDLQLDTLDCYADYAISNSDIRLCDKIHENEKIKNSEFLGDVSSARCKFVYARVKNNVNLCQEINPDKSTDYLLYNAECYAYFAALEDNSDYCNNVPDSHVDWCLNNKLRAWKTQITLCKNGTINCKEGYQLAEN